MNTYTHTHHTSERVSTMSIPDPILDAVLCRPARDCHQPRVEHIRSHTHYNVIIYEIP